MRPLGERFIMPERQPDDGDVGLAYIGPDHIQIAVGHNALLVSEHSAAQILGCLALLLGVRIHSTDAKAIKLTARPRDDDTP